MGKARVWWSLYNFMSYWQSFFATVFIGCRIYSAHPSQLWPTVGQNTITEEANYSLDVNVALLFQVSDQLRLLFPSNWMHIVLVYVHDAERYLAINYRFAIDLREWAMSHFLVATVIHSRDASTGHFKLLSRSIVTCARLFPYLNTFSLLRKTRVYIHVPKYVLNYLIYSASWMWFVIANSN